jgi:hypothetical protein
MKFVKVPDNEEWFTTNNMVSEKGTVEIGVWKVLFGFRVRAWFRGAGGAALDWCAGGDWKNVERLYSIALAILSKREENEICFEGLPSCSKIKPFFHDADFIEMVTREAGDFELIKLDKPAITI